MNSYGSWSMRWTIMKCAVAGGSRCTKAALHPGCTSPWLLTLTPRFTLLLAFISSCQAGRPREEVGGARGAGAPRWCQGFFLFCHWFGTDRRRPHRYHFLLQRRCIFVQGDDIMGGRILCSKRCWMLEEFFWAWASWSTAESRAN